MVKARITIGDREFLFDASTFDLANYSLEDLAFAMSATLEIFFADAARGALHRWADEEVK